MSRSFNVSYRFLAKDSFSGVSKKIQTNNKKLGKSFKKLDGNIKKSSSVFKGTSKSFVMGFKSMAIAAVGFFGIREFISTGSDFQTAMADMSSITGATGKDLKFFRDETLRLAKASATMAPEVANAFKLVASAKSDLLKDPKGLSKVTEQVLLLKNAAGIDLSQAANVVMESLNQFGAGAEQAAEFVNILAAGSKVGASEVGQTGAAIVKAGVAAGLAKLSFVELNASIQVLAQQGIKGELAGTQLKTSLLKLETTGIKKIMPSVVGLNSALDNLASMNLNAAQLSKLFGLEAIAAGQKLIENRATVKEWTTAMSGTAIAQEQATTNLSTFSAKMRKMGITFRDVFIKTFLRLEPLLSKLATQFTQFIGSIDEKKINAFADGLVKVATALGDIAGWISKLSLPDWLTSNMSSENALGKKHGSFLRSLFGDDSSSTSAKDLSSLSADLLKGVLSPGAPLGGSNSTTDINMNINAPAGVVQSIQSRTQGRAANVGFNMVEG